MKATTNNILWATEGDLFYLGYLINSYLDPWANYLGEDTPSEEEIEESVEFTKKLILITSGLVAPEDFDANPSAAIPPNLEIALAEFIDFFLLIYPHLEPYNTETEHWANVLHRRQQQLWGCLS